jgi:hypothetical protein
MDPLGVPVLQRGSVVRTSRVGVRQPSGSRAPGAHELPIGMRRPTNQQAVNHLTFLAARSSSIMEASPVWTVEPSLSVVASSSVEAKSDPNWSSSSVDADQRAEMMSLMQACLFARSQRHLLAREGLATQGAPPRPSRTPFDFQPWISETDEPQARLLPLPLLEYRMFQRQDRSLEQLRGCTRNEQEGRWQGTRRNTATHASFPHARQRHHSGSRSRCLSCPAKSRHCRVLPGSRVSFQA